MFAQPGAKSPHEGFYYYQGFRLGAVREGKWKLVIPSGGFGAQAKTPPPALQLFDLDVDISETKNLAAENPAVIARLQVLADTAREDLGDAARQMTGKGRRAPGKASSHHPDGK